MHRPQQTFTIVVSPVYYVHSCAEKLAEEARGLMGFHSYTRCPNCKLDWAGWEFWGENGHMQGSAPSRERLIHWLRLKAKEQWKATGHPNGMPKGTVFGYRFKLGGTIYYRG